MIIQLEMENFALFNKCRLAFSSGFNVISGESGAGKSLALEGIVSVFGARVNADRIGRFGDTMRLRVSLDVALDDRIWEDLAAFGMEPDEVLIVERQVAKDNRSSYRVQGQIVPAQVARTIGEAFVNYVGQHHLLKVANPQYIREWIDRYGNLFDMRQRVEKYFDAYETCDREVMGLESMAKDLDQLGTKQAMSEELVALQLEVGEDERIQRELAQLRAGRQLLQTSATVHDILDGDGNSGVLWNIAEVIRLMESLVSYDSRLQATLDNLRGCEELLQEARLDVSRWREGLDLDPMRLETLEVRADQITRAKRRYGPEESDILAYVKTLESEIRTLENLDWELSRARQKREKSYGELLAAATQLSNERRRVAIDASREVTSQVQHMEMPSAQVVFSMEPTTSCASHGQDSLEILFMANPGQELKPLSKAASGGELARVALALAVCGPSEENAVYIFDEVDQGLSGASADTVGQLLNQLGQKTQVIAVSHQPVVAARAASHHLVHKEIQADLSVARAIIVTERDRIMEIARMLSGGSDEVALQHAEVLLHQRR